MPLALKDVLPLLSEMCEGREQSRPLADIAAESGHSASHFQRSFRRLVGESPKQYQRRLQLELAAASLLCRDATILDIALEVGFESHEGFTRAFRGHFGMPPKDFRAKNRGAEPRLLAKYATLIEHLGPCLGLFRVSTQTTATQTTPMPAKRTTHVNYDIVKETLDAQTVLFRSARCETDAIAQTLGEILPSVFRYATESGIAIVGHPFTRYVSWGPALITLEAGLPVMDGAEGEGDIELGSLGGGPAVTTIHTGTYDSLGDAHAALQRFVSDNGLEEGGPTWEVYLTDPGEVPDPAKWKTKVVCPLRA